MQSDVTIRYQLDYKLTYDAELAKQYLPELWADADEDESLFAEYMEDDMIASLEWFESLKADGKPLPAYVTHFSLKEETS